MTRDDVLSTLRTASPHLASTYGIASLSLFGSTARSEQREGSDVDLLVSFDRPVGLFHLVRTQQELERILGRSVDLVTEAGLRPRVRERVLAEAIRVS